MIISTNNSKVHVFKFSPSFNDGADLKPLFSFETKDFLNNKGSQNSNIEHIEMHNEVIFLYR